MPSNCPILFREHVQHKDYLLQSLKKKYQQNTFNMNYVMQNMI